MNKETKRPLVRIIDGKKLCLRCGVIHPIDCFHKGGGRHTVKSYCKKCASERVKQYRKTIPSDVLKERNKYNALKCKFGLTAESLLELFIQQDSKCAICRNILDFASYGKSWVVDHDHDHHPGKRHPKGVKPRGLLCYRCNTALGNFMDDEKILHSAINYLTRQ